MSARQARRLGGALANGRGHLDRFLTKLIDPSASTPKPPQEMSDQELRHASCSLAGRLVDELGPIIQASFGGGVTDDPTWHRPWPTTVNMSVRHMFMTSLDALGSAAVVLERNASAASVGMLRLLDECYVHIIWVLNAESPAEQRSRVMALTRQSLHYAKRTTNHWGRVSEHPELARTQQIAGSIELALAELDALAAKRGLVIPDVPSRQTLFDTLHPGRYVSFAILSNIGAHPLPSPYFYGHPQTGRIDWAYKALDVERAYFVTKALGIELRTCSVVAPLCGWVGHECLLASVGERLPPLAEEASVRLNRKRDPTGILSGS